MLARSESQQSEGMMSQHDPVVHVKRSTAHTDEHGCHWPSMKLYRFDCSCGCWHGAAWYGSEARAREHFDEHRSRLERGCPIRIDLSRPCPVVV